MFFDYRMVKEFEGKDFDFNDYVGVSGKESDLHLLFIISPQTDICMER